MLHNTVVGWSYERCVPDNLLYKYGSHCWVITQASCAREYTFEHMLWMSSRGLELMASNKDKRERNRLRRQMETAEEREARSINLLGHFGIYISFV